MRNSIFKQKGFTLIELMVVIAIIGLLASIITVSLVSSKVKGRDAKRVADIRTLQLALETFYNDNGTYPLTLQSLTPSYLPKLPNDPSAALGSDCVNGGEAGCYAYNSFGNSSSCGSVATPVGIYKYHLGAALESNETTNIQTFLQDADWTVAAPYVWCTGGGGVTGSLTAFPGKGTNNGGKCSTSVSATDACYDVTN